MRWRRSFTYWPSWFVECFSVRVDEAAQFSFVPFLEKNNAVVNYQLLLAVTLEFSLIAFSYRPGGARCGKFDIMVKYERPPNSIDENGPKIVIIIIFRSNVFAQINFDNQNMDGLMEVSLQSNLKRHVCPHDPNFSSMLPIFPHCYLSSR